MTAVVDLIDVVSGLLVDPGNDNWPVATLVEYLNDGLRTLAKYAPAQFYEYTTLTLVDGAKQTLPATAVRIVSPGFSLDGSGNRVRSIRLVDKDLLDAASPTWQAAAIGVTRQLALSPGNTNEYWVSPPGVAGATIEAQVEAVPATLTQSSSIPVDAMYEPALVDYVLFRAYSQDAEYAAQDGRASLHYQRFMSVVAPPDESE